MIRANLQIGLLMSLCLSACAGCVRVEPPLELTADEIVASFVNARLQSEADVQRVVVNVVASEQAILFVNLGWATMKPQRKQSDLVRQTEQIMSLAITDKETVNGRRM